MERSSKERAERECHNQPESETAALRCIVFIAASLDGYIARRDGSLDWLPGAESGVEGGQGTNETPSPPCLSPEMEARADSSLTTCLPDSSGRADSGDVHNANVPPSSGDGTPDLFEYTSVTETVDAIIMGRNTFDAVTLRLSPNVWPYAGKRVYVVTSQGRPKKGGACEANLESPGGGVTQDRATLLEGHDVRFLDPGVFGKGERERAVGIRESLIREGVKTVYVDGGRLIQSFLHQGWIDDFILTTFPVLLGDGIPLFRRTQSIEGKDYASESDSQKGGRQVLPGKGDPRDTSTGDQREAPSPLHEEATRVDSQGVKTDAGETDKPSQGTGLSRLGDLHFQAVATRLQRVGASCAVQTHFKKTSLHLN
uniref:Bacterial bifunctional deaminase-reductase C-terminal domain-containing protein n=1 Tax=Chromera velia CCMP2878 TaxID=1169474 RepID=A0A0G4HU18_9ALVE|eukprot:Cvel_8528.t1-p1 / transcript=Cvel_8528.t1 / gene=Cvel_8528 / organism=Chromera_velia_CCMP2878 / gene_product=hypothetical protein / transcript_product=hypothetical protein / location=Cvel_scaffold472:81256-82362(+) / protein_length=369 / sequence_SO=supercontig / SO=protein_coding / is_pseudo=false